MQIKSHTIRPSPFRSRKGLGLVKALDSRIRMALELLSRGSASSAEIQEQTGADIVNLVEMARAGYIRSKPIRGETNKPGGHGIQVSILSAGRRALAEGKFITVAEVKEKGAIASAARWLADRWAKLEERYGRKVALTMAVAGLATFPIPGNVTAIIAAAEAIRAIQGWVSKSLSLDEIKALGKSAQRDQTVRNSRTGESGLVVRVVGDIAVVQVKPSGQGDDGIREWKASDCEPVDGTKGLPGEDCPHCGASMERGDNGNCNTCGKPWPEAKDLDVEELLRRFLAQREEKGIRIHPGRAIYKCPRCGGKAHNGPPETPTSSFRGGGVCEDCKEGFSIVGLNLKPERDAIPSDFKALTHSRFMLQGLVQEFRSFMEKLRSFGVRVPSLSDEQIARTLEQAMDEAERQEGFRPRKNIPPIVYTERWAIPMMKPSSFSLRKRISLTSENSP